MDEYLIQGSTLTDIADAIRDKTGDDALMTPAEMVEAIEAIQTGGGTLRTTHYHGTLSYSNQAVYNPVIPVTDILSTDIVLVIMKLKRTGTVTDGVTTWNDELVVPSAFGSTGVRLAVIYRAGINFGSVRIKGTNGTTQNELYVVNPTMRSVYANSYGNDIDIQSVGVDENGITLTQRGWNTRVCTTGVATEYEYDVYIMAENGNAIVNEG